MTTHDNDKAHDAAELLPCPFCGGKAIEMAGLVGCEPCAIARRDAHSWNRRSALTASEAKTVDAAKVRKLRDLAKEGREEADSWALDGYTGPWKLMERMADAIDMLLKSSPPEAQQPFAALSAQSAA